VCMPSDKLIQSATIRYDVIASCTVGLMAGGRGYHVCLASGKGRYAGMT